MPNSRRLLTVLLFAGVLLSFLAAGTSHGAATGTSRGAQPPPTGAEWSSKVDPELRHALAAAPTSDFFIVLTEQVDLTAAAGLPTKEARGQAVYDALRATATRTQAPLRAQLDSLGVAYETFYISNKIYVAGGDQGLIAALAARDDVARLVINHTYQLPEPQASEKSLAPESIEPNLVFVNADEVWNLGIDGSGAVLAGNDTGIQWDHPALKNQYRGWNGSTVDHNYSWWDATGTYLAAPGDGNGHGTHTTGTMVGSDGANNQIGVAPGAKTIHCKNLTDGGFGTDADIIECFQWDLAPWDLSGNNPRPDLAPDAINNSWGGPGGSATFASEIAALQAAGILVEFSAGNAGPSCFSLGSPGDFGEVLTTGSVNHVAAYPGTISDFSSRGPSAFTSDPVPDIMAPGENIRSSLPGGGYGSLSGTSMAGPHVTGLVGLMLSANPGLRGFIPELQQIIMQTAAPLSGQSGSNCGGDYDQGPNNDWGHGTIDALAAVQAAQLFGEPGFLTGAVTDTGAVPLAGARVRATLSPELNWKRLTDASGLYALTIFSGTYTVDASLYGYYTEVVTDVAIVANETTTLNFELQPAPVYTVTGTVSDAAGGWPLYAQISVAGFPGAPVWTDPATGAYSIQLAAGTEYVFHVTPWSVGYLPVTAPLTLSGDTTLDFPLQADSQLCVAPGYQPDFVYFSDFEADNGGFTVEGAPTSWAWGTPRSGPGAALSGEFAWGTNLAGNYGSNENGSIVSPPVDLSSYSDGLIVLSWWQYLITEGGFDFASVQVSNDGGVSWASVYGPVSGFVNDSWSRQVIYLDGSTYAVPNFRVRFDLLSDFVIEAPGFYVDNVGIGIASVEPAVFATDFEGSDGGFAATGSNSSWAYGTPTRGPGAAHSGSSAWATNLGGNYNDSEDSALTSPVIDLSALAGEMVDVTWWQWAQTEAQYDTYTVSFSNDGGATWQPFAVWSGVLDTAWSEVRFILPAEYATGEFAIQLQLQSDGSVTYPGIYIDDLAVRRFAAAPANVGCTLQTGGLVFGHVFDANTGLGLNGARVVADSGVRVLTQPTPADSQLADGFFLAFLEAGGHTLTGSSSGYAAVTEPLTVPAGSAQRQDLILPAALISTAPTAISVTVAMSDTGVASFDLVNSGGISATFELRERNAAFQPLAGPVAGSGEWLYQATNGVTVGQNQPDNRAGTAFPAAYRWLANGGGGEPTVLVYVDDAVHTAPQTYVDQALQALGISYEAHYEADFSGFTSSLTSGTWDVVIFADDNYYPDPATYDALYNYAAAGGKLIFHSWTVGFYLGHPLFDLLGFTYAGDNFEPPQNVYWWEPDHPLFTRPESVPPFTELTGGRYGIYGQLVEPLPGAMALGGATGEPQPDQAKLILANDGRTLFRAFLDGQNDADLDQDGLPDGAELWMDAIDGIQQEFAADIDWLATDVITGTIAANDALSVQLLFDATAPSVVQPGTYSAVLRVVDSSPYSGALLPVAMHVTPPAGWGRVLGTVSGLGRCDQPGLPLAKATVTINGTAELKSGADGSYVYWLPAGMHSFTFSAGGYLSQTQNFTVTAGGSETHDVNLRLAAACVAEAPAPVNLTVAQGAIVTVTATLANGGAEPLSFNFLETSYVDNPSLLTPAEAARHFTPATGTGPTSLLAAEPTGAAEPLLPASGWFGAVDHPLGALRYGFAQCAEQPQSYYIVSGVTSAFNISKALYRFDAAANAWTRLRDIPSGSEAPSATCYRGRLYVAGGGGSNQFYVYDIAADTWYLGAALPRGVEGAAMAAWGGSVYLVGGDDDFFPGSGVSDAVDIYDIATDTWTGNGAPLPVPVSNAGWVQVGPVLYVVGGWGVDAPATNVQATQRYDLVGDQWELGPAFAGARADFALAATDAALYAIGGDADGGSFFDASPAVDRLTLDGWPGGSWLSLGDPLSVPLAANNAGFCTSALFQSDTAEVWSVGGIDTRTFSGTGRTLFREMAGERCPSIYEDLPWLSVLPGSGEIAADDAVTLTIVVDATSLPAGAQRAALALVTNDSGAALTLITIDVTVMPTYLMYFPVIYRR